MTMRKLLYVPMINMNADLGELACDFYMHRNITFHDREWKRHEQTVFGFWDSLSESRLA